MVSQIEVEQNIHSTEATRENYSGNLLLVIFISCLVVEVALVLLDLLVNWLQWSESRAIRRMFNITREDGLASLFAIVQTVCVAIIAWIIYLMATRQPGNRFLSMGWLVLAIFFTYMVIDDGAMVHERIGTAIRKANIGDSYPSYGWQIVLAPLFVLMGGFIVWFLWNRNKGTIRRIWLLAAISCLGAALMLDFAEGLEDGYQLLIELTLWSEKTVRHFAKSLEEFLEMMGMSLLLIVFLDHLGCLTEETEIRIAGRKIQFIDRSGNRSSS